MSRIAGHLPDDVHLHLDSNLSYVHPDRWFMEKYRRRGKDGKRKWDGIIRLYHRAQGQSFYTGLLSLVCNTLDADNISYQKIDTRKTPPINLPHLTFTPPKYFEDRDYQSITVDRSVSRTRGVLKVATGGGKTAIVSQIIGKIQRSPCLFYVLTKDLMRQAHETLSETLNEPIGQIGGGKCDIQKINICTVQTAIRALHQGDSSFRISDYLYDDEEDEEEAIKACEKNQAIRDLIGSARVVYVDECHHAACRIITEVLSASPHAYWRYGGSATPYREDNAELVIQAMFGKKIVDISASYLIENGYLIEPYILFEKITHDVPYHSYPKIYAECVAKNEEFNAHVAATAKHLIDRGLSTLILVKQFNQGNLLKSMIPYTEFVTSKMTTKRRNQAIDDLRQKKKLCMIATSLADEGLDVPTLDAAILAGGGASSTRTFQRVGRTLRPDRNSPSPRSKSIVVYYEHSNKMLQKQASKARKILKEEPAFHIVRSNGPDYICGEIDGIMETGPPPISIWDAV